MGTYKFAIKGTVETEEISFNDGLAIENLLYDMEYNKDLEYDDDKDVYIVDKDGFDWIVELNNNYDKVDELIEELENDYSFDDHKVIYEAVVGSDWETAPILMLEALEEEREILEKVDELSNRLAEEYFYKDEEINRLLFTTNDWQPELLTGAEQLEALEKEIEVLGEPDESMKRVVDGSLLDTSTAQYIGTYSNGLGYNDFNYIHETLYKTKSGVYFLHAEGGANTIYRDMVYGSNEWYGSGETLFKFKSEKDAEKWASEYLDDDDYDKHFVLEEEKKMNKTYSLKESTIDKIEILRTKKHATNSEIVDLAVAYYFDCEIKNK